MAPISKDLSPLPHGKAACGEAPPSPGSSTVVSSASADALSLDSLPVASELAAGAPGAASDVDAPGDAAQDAQGAHDAAEQDQEPGPPSSESSTPRRSLSRPASAMRTRNVRRLKSSRHLEEAMREGAGASVLRTAMLAAEQHHCKASLLGRAAAMLSLVQELEAAMDSGDAGRLRRALLAAERGDAGQHTAEAHRQLALLEAGIRYPAPQPGQRPLAAPEPGVAAAGAGVEDAGRLASIAEKLCADEEREARRYAALCGLEAAAGCAALEEAIWAAIAAGVSAGAMLPFRERLAAARAIQEALEWGLTNQSLPAIRQAIANRATGMLTQEQLARAEATLAAEESREELRAKLGDAWERLTQAAADVPEERSELGTAAFDAASAELRRLIEEGRGLAISDEELTVYEERLWREERRLFALSQLRAAAAVTKGLDVRVADLQDLLRAKQQLQATLAEAAAACLPEADIATLDKDRRRIHNAIEDRRGAVRVHCRVRPLSSGEAALGEGEIVRCRDGLTVEVEPGHGRHECDSPSHHMRGERDGDPGGAFAFDACWAPGSQQEVFDDMRDLVQSAVDGYNVTVFAYGQTGAGKTHTMYGPKQVLPPQRVGTKRSDSALDVGLDETRGICPRTTEEVFRIVKRDSGRFEFTVTFSMVELYCQRFIDLLDPSAERPLRIRNLRGSEVYLENQQERVVRCPEDVEPLVRAGLAARHVRSTCRNPESSRSHVLFQLRITSVNRETRQMVRGKVLLVDLAGSERVKRSDVCGAGLKEAIEVNRSLTALADVVAALAHSEKHVPYRNHELTQVMQDSLGGSAKTLMLVNLSPLACHGEETIMSLKFAQRVKGVISQAPRSWRPELRPSLSSP